MQKELQQLTDAAWKIIDRAGQRRPEHGLQVSAQLVSTSSTNEAVTYSIRYYPQMMCPIAQADYHFDADSALDAFDLEISKL